MALESEIDGWARRSAIGLSFQSVYNPAGCWPLVVGCLPFVIVHLSLIIVNCSMPTPVQHLVLAQRLLDDSILPGSIRQRLLAQHSAFLFGNTAPDVQNGVRPIARRDTLLRHSLGACARAAQRAVQPLSSAAPHPIAAGRSRGVSRRLHLPPVARCAVGARHLSERLRPAGALGREPARTAPVSQHPADVVRSQRSAAARRFDRGRVGRRKPDRVAALHADQHLVQWRDVLAEQLHPGATVRTVEVFAGRGGVTEEEFQRVLASPDEMERHVFAHAPHDRIEKFYRDGYEQMAQLITEYFQATTIHRRRS